MTGDRDLDRELALELERLAGRGLRRVLERAPAAPGIDFASNDTLGLARDPRLAAGARMALEAHGAGSRAARLLGGAPAILAELEAEAARWLGTETALFLPSGFQANLAAITALAGPGDAILSDALNHASIVDGCRLSGARVLVYAHADPASLERRLIEATGARRRVVVSESVFSMDGDLAPLAELEALCRRRDAWLVVDEAHAIGLLGPRGAGAWRAAFPAAAGSDSGERLAALVAPCGKALGAAGALIGCSASVRDWIVQRARAFVYTTAPAPAVAGAVLAAIGAVRDADEARGAALARAKQLAWLIDRAEPAACIVPIVIGEARVAVRVAEELAGAGFDVRAARPPTVPEGGARLRVTCHAFNSPAEIEVLAGALRKHLPAGAFPATGYVSAPRARAVFVAGTDTGVGKTVASAALLSAARALGPARYWKPVQTGSDSDTGEVARLAGAAARELIDPAHCYALPASPHEAARAAGGSIDPDDLAAALDRHRRAVPDGTLVVELAGGLLVPYSVDARGARTQADWLASERLPVVLVARAGLGTLNHTLLSLEALRARRVEPRGLILVGAPHASNRAALELASGGLAVLELPPLALDARGAVDPGALARWAREQPLAQLLRG